MKNVLFVCVLSYSLSSCSPGTGKQATAQDSLLQAIHICTQLPGRSAHDFGFRKQGGIFSLSRWAWQPGQARVLHIAFLDGNPQVIEKVLAVSKEWEPIVNIQFVKVSDPSQAEIKISFSETGSWSAIGTDALGRQVSMNLGWLTPSTADIEYHRVVLHEFGHVLGFGHEHQLPNGNPIIWNTDVVYAYYEGKPNFWTPEEVDENVLRQYSADLLIGGHFDPKSIMLYAIPPTMTMDGYSVGWNSALSAEDRQLAAEAYNN